MSSDDSRIRAAFRRRNDDGALAFVPFVTAGDPDLATSVQVVERLAASGADVIEIGFPYSDPIADGPVIQASYTRALARALHVDEIFSAFEKLTGKVAPPLVAMVSYAIVFRTGSRAFVEKARRAGFSGLIVPDLPAEEGEELGTLARASGLDLVQLVAPTTPVERARQIVGSASGFVYCIAVAGTTGVREQLPATLTEQLRRLRTLTDLPLAVGFGIGRPEQVAALKGLADGAIVGSALVRRIAEMAEQPARAEPILAEFGRFAAELAHAAHQPG